MAACSSIVETLIFEGLVVLDFPLLFEEWHCRRAKL